MRKRHKPSRNVTRTPPSPMEDEPKEMRAARERYPWESAGEYSKFCYYLFLGPGRSVRRAYQAWCIDSKIEPKANPPSSWYDLYNGRYAAFRKAERQSKAIEHAGEEHGRFPDWETLEATIQEAGLLKEFEGGEHYEIMHDLTIIDFAFQSLAIDSKGDPKPGEPTWDERRAAYWEAVESGEVDPPGEVDVV